MGELSLCKVLGLFPHLIDKVSIFKYTVTSLDLSQNQLSSISFLEGFDHLESLNLHNNNITSSIIFPKFINLNNLYISNNNISDIGLFLDNNKDQLPSLIHLVTLDNECNPYFNNPNVYPQYRLLVLSRINLLLLDNMEVTDFERKSALISYQTVIEPEPFEIEYMSLEYGFWRYHPKPNTFLDEHTKQLYGDFGMYIFQTPNFDIVIEIF